MNDEFKQPVNRNIYLQSPSEWVEIIVQIGWLAKETIAFPELYPAFRNTIVSVGQLFVRYFCLLCFLFLPLRL